MNIDKKLDEILDDFKIWEHWVEDGVQKHNQIQPDKAKQEIKQLFQELIEKVIGEEVCICKNKHDDRTCSDEGILQNYYRQKAKELLENM